MDICRLIYRSRTGLDDFTNESLQHLGEKSSEANAEQAITGLLLLSDHTFLQVLEGSSESVNELYLKILADPRHEEVRLMKFGPVSNRLFGEWGMNVIDLFDIPKEARDVFRAKYSERDSFIEIPQDPDMALSLLLDAKGLLAESF